jgi:hypothetical protein
MVEEYKQYPIALTYSFKNDIIQLLFQSGNLLACDRILPDWEDHLQAS